MINLLLKSKRKGRKYQTRLAHGRVSIVIEVKASLLAYDGICRSFSPRQVGTMDIEGKPFFDTRVSKSFTVARLLVILTRFLINLPDLPEKPDTC